MLWRWDILRISYEYKDVLLYNKCISHSTNRIQKKDQQIPNGHISVDSPSISRRNSTRKICWGIIDFEKRIYVEITTSIRRGNFDVDSTFDIDEISMNSPRAFFYVVSTSNWHNFCARCSVSNILTFLLQESVLG